jgi:hypothetical protein
VRAPRFKLPKFGTCRVCGCTDDNACDGGCWWTDGTHTLCSTCDGTAEDLAYTLRWVSTLIGKRSMPARFTKLAAKLAKDALARHARARQQAGERR